MELFLIDNAAHRKQWCAIPLAIERRLVPADARPGMLADKLSDYLFARSTGHIGSLMTLINCGCQRAVRTGTERMDQAVLDGVKSDAAAENGRRELGAAFAARRLSTRSAGATSAGRRRPKASPAGSCWRYRACSSTRSSRSTTRRRTRPGTTTASTAAARCATPASPAPSPPSTYSWNPTSLAVPGSG
ncbi:hypothetical protein [Nocardia sp. NRRL S-836]|uniref:hypothetical protein n=1 Tax=Nocardia sp. NRRL S-836 TaxID=1519492 RepID=UPI000A46C75C|nr:hypothetical protein [Nocardia sp. NRRL S-836]